MAKKKMKEEKIDSSKFKNFYYQVEGHIEYTKDYLTVISINQSSATKFAQHFFGEDYKATKITKKESEGLGYIGCLIQHSEETYRKNIIPKYNF